MDYPVKMMARFTPRRYALITGQTEQQVYMKMYIIKYRQVNRERLLKHSREYHQRTKVLKRVSDNQTQTPAGSV